MIINTNLRQFQYIQTGGGGGDGRDVVDFKDLYMYI